MTARCSCPEEVSVLLAEVSAPGEPHQQRCVGSAYPSREGLDDVGAQGLVELVVIRPEARLVGPGQPHVHDRRKHPASFGDDVVQHRSPQVPLRGW